MRPTRNFTIFDDESQFADGVFQRLDTSGEWLPPTPYDRACEALRGVRQGLLRGDVLKRTAKHDADRCFVSVELRPSVSSAFTEPTIADARALGVVRTIGPTYDEWIGDGSGVRWIVGVPTLPAAPMQYTGDGCTITVSPEIVLSFMTRNETPIRHVTTEMWNWIVTAVAPPRLSGEDFLLTVWNGAEHGFYSTYGKPGRNERQVLADLGVSLPNTVAERDRVIKEARRAQGEQATAAKNRGERYDNPFLMWNDIGTAPLSPLTEASFVGAPWQTLSVDFYFTVLGFQNATTSRTSKDAPRVAGCLFLDVDAPLVDDTATIAQYFTVIERAFLLPPSIVNESGAGRHYYWLLEEALRLTTHAERHAFKTTLEQWHATVHSEATPVDKPDLSRVLRIPGTMNWKARYRRPIPVVVAHYDPAIQYPYAELLDRIAEHRRSATIFGQAPATSPTPLIPMVEATPSPIVLPVDPRLWADWLTRTRLEPMQKRLREAPDGERHPMLMREIFTLGGLHACVTDDGLRPLRDICTADRCREAVFAGIDANRTAGQSQATARTMFDAEWAAGVASPFRVVFEGTIATPKSVEPQPMDVGVERVADSGRFALIDPFVFWPTQPEPSWIVPGLVPVTGYCIHYAERDNLKTAYIADLMQKAIITHYDRTGEQKTVIYIATENERGFGWRMKDWADLSGHPRADLVRANFRQFLPKSQRFELRDVSLMAELAVQINALDRPILGIVIDTLRMAFTGSGNDDEIGAEINRCILTLMGAVHGEPFVYALHHTGLNTERMRGTTAIGDNTMLTSRGVYRRKDERLLVTVERMKWENPPARPYEYAVEWFRDHPPTSETTPDGHPWTRKRTWVRFTPVDALGERPRWTVNESELAILRFVFHNDAGGGAVSSAIRESTKNGSEHVRKLLNFAPGDPPRPALLQTTEEQRGSRPARIALTPEGREFVQRSEPSTDDD